MKRPAKSACPERHLRLVRAAELPAQIPQKAWLVRDLWADLAVGFIGGQPKTGKTWLALDLAVSVASGTHCLGRFPVDQPGPALAYFAEDSLPRVRERLAALCAHRHIPLANLDLHLIDAPSLRLDDPADQAPLVEAITLLKPRLLILDPLVRLHTLDENSAADISSLLGWLRALSRDHDLGIVVVHHMSKKSRRQLGQALRGSSDLHAWADSSAYLTRRQDKLLLTLEHRSSPARSPLGLQLAPGTDGATPHLEPFLEAIASVDSPPPIADRIVHALREAKAPLSRVVLRNKLHVNNLKLGEALASLERDRVIARTDSGWSLSATSTAARLPTTAHPETSSNHQLDLPLPPPNNRPR
jgi:hypothetical protein